MLIHMLIRQLCKISEAKSGFRFHQDVRRTDMRGLESFCQFPVHRLKKNGTLLGFKNHRLTLWLVVLWYQ
jgi:hypothetical protein